MTAATTYEETTTTRTATFPDREPPAVSAPKALWRSARAELLRLRRWPVTWILVGVWILLNIVFGYVFNWIAYSSGSAPAVGPQTGGDQLLAEMLPANLPAVLVQGMPMFGGAIVMILAALAVGSGYGWGTWKTVLTQGPSRTTAFGGTLLALGTIVIGLVLACAAVDLGVATMIAAIEDGSAALPAIGDLARGVGGGVLIMGMWASAGVLLGVLARGPALAVGLGLVWSLVVENLLRGVSGLIDGLPAVTDRLPGSSGGSLAGALGGAGEAQGGAPGVLDALSGSTAALWVAGYLVVFTAIAVLLIRRRDLT